LVKKEEQIKDNRLDRTCVGWKRCRIQRHINVITLLLFMKLQKKLH